MKLPDLDYARLEDAASRAEPELQAAARFLLKIYRRRVQLDQYKRPAPIRYPIYILSKLNPEHSTAMRYLMQRDVPFSIVVEPQDRTAYERYWPKQTLELPENDRGLSYARNFTKQHSREAGERKHWQFDDDVTGFSVFEDNVISVTHPTRVLAAIEEVCEPFENIAAAGPSNASFKPSAAEDPLRYNKLIAGSCMLVDNACDVPWSIDRVEDINYSLEVLVKGWATIKFAFQLFSKQNDLQFSGNYSASEKYEQAIVTLMQKWPDVFQRNRRDGRLRSNVWQLFDQRPQQKFVAPVTLFEETE